MTEVNNEPFRDTPDAVAAARAQQKSRECNSKTPRQNEKNVASKQRRSSPGGVENAPAWPEVNNEPFPNTPKAGAAARSQQKIRKRSPTKSQKSDKQPASKRRCSSPAGVRSTPPTPDVEAEAFPNTPEAGAQQESLKCSLTKGQKSEEKAPARKRRRLPDDAARLPDGRSFVHCTASFRAERAKEARLAIGGVLPSSPPTERAMSGLSELARTTATTCSGLCRLASALMAEGFHLDYVSMLCDRRVLGAAETEEFGRLIEAKYCKVKSKFRSKQGHEHWFDFSAFLNAVLQLRATAATEGTVAEMIPSMTEEQALAFVTPSVGACAPGYGKCVMLDYFGCKHMAAVNARMVALRHAKKTFEQAKGLVTGLVEGVFVRFGLHFGLPWSTITDKPDEVVANLCFGFLHRRPQFCLKYIRAALSLYGCPERYDIIRALVSNKQGRSYKRPGPTKKQREKVMAALEVNAPAPKRKKWYTKKKIGCEKKGWDVGLAVKALSPIPFAEKPTGEAMGLFAKWLTGIEWSFAVHTSLSNDLREGGFHEEYVSAAKAVTAITPNDEKLFQRMVGKAVVGKRLHKNGTYYSTWMTPDGTGRLTRKFLTRAVCALRSLSGGWGAGGGKDAERMVRELTDDEMRRFVVSITGTIRAFNLLMVEVVGASNVKAAREAQSLVANAHRDFLILRNRGLANELFLPQFTSICVALRVAPAMITTVDPAVLVERMDDLPTLITKKKALRYIKAMLSSQRKSDYMYRLERALGPRSRLTSPEDAFVNGDPWRVSLLQEIKLQHTNSCRRKSAYASRQVRANVRAEVHALEFIDKWARLKDKKFLAAPDPVLQFMTLATSQDFEDVLVAYGSTAAANNKIVRSSRAEHQATLKVARMLCMLRIRCRKHIKDSAGLAHIKVSQILAQIPDHRVRASQLVRRTYTDEEMDRMEAVVKGDVSARLMLAIFRRVGLRRGAVAHLRFVQLFDEKDLPRRVCRVMEKGNKVREFVVPPAVKEAAIAYAKEARQWQPELNPEKFYIFGEDNTRPSGRINTEIKRIGEAADVHARMYPHAFRHTIVGQLVDGGHSMEDIAAWLGHSDSRTTARHYYVPTVMALHDKLFSEVVSAPDVAVIEACEQKVQHVEQKVEIGREMLEVYNREIQALAKVHPEAAAALVRSLCDRMPDLRERIVMLDNAPDVSSLPSPPQPPSVHIPGVGLGSLHLAQEAAEQDGEEEEWEDLGGFLAEDAAPEEPPAAEEDVSDVSDDEVAASEEEEGDVSDVSGDELASQEEEEDVSDVSDVSDAEEEDEPAEEEDEPAEGDDEPTNDEDLWEDLDT